jgi:hypothetical protein
MQLALHVSDERLLAVEWCEDSSLFSRESAADNQKNDTRLHLIGVLALIAFPVFTQAQIPVFEVTPVESTINFDMEASVRRPRPGLQRRSLRSRKRKGHSVIFQP